MKQISTVIEVILFVSALFALLFFNLPNSNSIILPATIIIGLRLAWLLSKKDLTLDRNFLKNGSLFSGLLQYGTVLFLALGFLSIFKDNARSLPEWLTDQEPIWFSLLHIGGQELIFRVFLLSRLQLLLNNRFFIAALSGLLFGLTHLILPNAWTVAIITSVLGTAWGYIYQKYPNFILVCLSHVLLNIAIKYLVLQ